MAGEESFELSIEVLQAIEFTRVRDTVVLCSGTSNEGSVTDSERVKDCCGSATPSLRDSCAMNDVRRDNKRTSAPSFSHSRIVEGATALVGPALDQTSVSTECHSHLETSAHRERHKRLEFFDKVGPHHSAEPKPLVVAKRSQRIWLPPTSYTNTKGSTPGLTTHLASESSTL